MRISDWSSDVCSSDLLAEEASVSVGQIYRLFTDKDDVILAIVEENVRVRLAEMHSIFDAVERRELAMFEAIKAIAANSLHNEDGSLFYEILAEARSEEHTSEIQSLMRISYAVCCLKKQNINTVNTIK